MKQNAADGFLDHCEWCCRDDRLWVNTSFDFAFHFNDDPSTQQDTNGSPSTCKHIEKSIESGIGHSFADWKDRQHVAQGCHIPANGRRWIPCQPSRQHMVDTITLSQPLFDMRSSLEPKQQNDPISGDDITEMEGEVRT
jgi:hypothetical protein